MRKEQVDVLLIPLEHQPSNTMTLNEKLYDLAEIDALPNCEEFALYLVDDPAVCFQAITQYLQFNPHKWEALANANVDF